MKYVVWFECPVCGSVLYYCDGDDSDKHDYRGRTGFCCGVRSIHQHLANFKSRTIKEQKYFGHNKGFHPVHKMVKKKGKERPIL